MILKAHALHSGEHNFVTCYLFIWIQLPIALRQIHIYHRSQQTNSQKLFSYLQELIKIWD